LIKLSIFGVSNKQIIEDNCRQGFAQEEVIHSLRQFTPAFPIATQPVYMLKICELLFNRLQ